MPEPLRPPQTPIAIVGAGALLPGSSGVGGFWRTVVTGRDLITDVPPSHWLIEDYYDPDPAAPDRTYGRRGAFLDPVDFPALTYGVPPNTLEATDTSQLLALMVADQVLTDATGGDLAGLDRDRVSVMLGTGALELLYSMSNRPSTS
ncbi:beta-ketoacyl synthase N-terminal-like domain-containing protein [Streptomyces sp. NPDC048179]|uniref:beta-ketoacyl synthase N-terminal-like domain-containing protein n=1 Tax=Streptomyces sp. NPDC048179 TaxID=3365506 RepID=UPI00371334A4